MSTESQLFDRRPQPFDERSGAAEGPSRCSHAFSAGSRSQPLSQAPPPSPILGGQGSKTYSHFSERVAARYGRRLAQTLGDRPAALVTLTYPDGPSEARLFSAAGVLLNRSSARGCDIVVTAQDSPEGRGHFHGVATGNLNALPECWPFSNAPAIRLDQIPKGARRLGDLIQIVRYALREVRDEQELLHLTFGTEPMLRQLHLALADLPIVRAFPDDRRCLFCAALLHGRADRKYCGSACRGKAYRRQVASG